MSRYLTQLGYVGLEVSDLAAWDVFAGEVLGLGISPGPTANSRYLRLDGNDRRFLLTEGPADDITFAGWETPDRPSLDAFAQHLETKRVPFQWGSADEARQRGVRAFLYFADAIGARHEVFHGPLMGRERFVSPKVAEGFVTGGGGLGHVVFGAGKQYNTAVAFADDVIGAAMTDICVQPTGPDSRIEVSFLHINQRHHSIAYADESGPKKLHHFMIETARVDEVGRARDRALAHGFKLAQDIGQHSNDKMISFYVITPSGFQAEFGWGGVHVHDDNWRVVTYPSFSEWGHRPPGA